MIVNVAYLVLGLVVGQKRQFEDIGLWETEMRMFFFLFLIVIFKFIDKTN